MNPGETVDERITDAPDGRAELQKWENVNNNNNN